MGKCKNLASNTFLVRRFSALFLPAKARKRLSTNLENSDRKTRKGRFFARSTSTKHKYSRLRPAGWLLAGCVLAGCQVNPSQRDSRIALPDLYSMSLEGQTGRGPEGLAEWWKDFEDPKLDLLIGQALTSNLDLKAARARLREARAARKVVAGDLLPEIEANGGYQKSRLSERTSGRPPGLTTVQDVYRTGFDAAWEIDLWGGVRQAIRAAEAGITAAYDDTGAIAVSLLSEVAVNYLELREAQQRLEVARQNLETQSEALAIAKARFNAGLTSELDASQAESLRALTRAQVPVLQVAERASLYRLSVLLGQPPLALKEKLSEPAPIPTGLPRVSAEAPAELLRRRPDLLRAERQLVAATARIGVAQAQLYPKFSLTGSFHLEGKKISSLGFLDSRAWNFGPTISLPIFDRRKLHGQVEMEDARAAQALANYENAILGAMEEVENALQAYAREKERYRSLEEAEKANQRSLRQSNELYRKGLVDFLNVIDAQRSLLDTQDLLVQSQAQASVQLVRLYKALGGGWSERESALQVAQMKAAK